MSVLNIKLCELIQPERVLELNAAGKREALETLSHALAADPRVTDGQALFDAILRREEQVSTGIGLGIAIPHVKIPQVTDTVLAVGRCRPGLEFEALDKQPVNLIFMIAASDQQTKEFVRILAKVTHLLKDYDTRQALLAAQLPDGFINIIRANEQ